MSDLTNLTDEKGRLSVNEMTDREILEEILLTLRGGTDALESIGKNPMLKAFLPSF